MTNVLVLVPCKPNLHPVLKAKMRALLSRMPAANPTLAMDLVIDEQGAGDRHIKTLEERVAHTAVIRQSMIDRWLTVDHDFVLWIDADVIDYPSNLPTELITRGAGNVAAPFVYLDKHGERFYDIAGFVENGNWFKLFPPHCAQVGPVFTLDGVGCVYLVPAPVYRQGGKHGPCEGYTDHFRICTRARELGYKVLAFSELKAYHAYLAEYGEGFH